MNDGDNHYKTFLDGAGSNLTNTASPPLKKAAFEYWQKGLSTVPVIFVKEGDGKTRKQPLIEWSGLPERKQTLQDFEADSVLECDRKSILQWGLFYHDKGFCVIPAKYGDKRPIVAWEQFQKERPSKEQVVQWFKKRARKRKLTKGLFGQGLFMIKVTGKGLLFINTYGAIDKHTLQPGQKLVVDNFHLVAFSDTCQYKVTKFGGLKETVLGGEGLVTRSQGRERFTFRRRI